VLRQLAEPHTCTEVASRLGQTPQRVYYHVKRLVDAGLADLVSERKVRGIHEGIYQASARSYWLSPRLVGRIVYRADTGERPVTWCFADRDGHVGALAEVRPGRATGGAGARVRGPGQRPALGPVRGQLGCLSRKARVAAAKSGELKML
jgi:DNA-binding transcriptional ArsR family regulator